MERGDIQLNATISRFFAVALGLLFLGKQGACEGVIMGLDSIRHKIGKIIIIIKANIARQQLLDSLISVQEMSAKYRYCKG